MNEAQLRQLLAAIFDYADTGYGKRGLITIDSNEALYLAVKPFSESNND